MRALFLILALAVSFSVMAQTATNTPEPDAQAQLDEGKQIIRNTEVQLFKAEIKRGLQPEPEISYTAPLSVNVSCVTESQLEAGGYKSPEVTTADYPPLKDCVEVQAQLMILKIHKAIKKEEVLRTLGRFDLKPAGIPELLALGGKYPDVEKECVIVALGTEWDVRYKSDLGTIAESRVASLAWDGARYLGSTWIYRNMGTGSPGNRQFSKGTCFLGIRK